MFSHAEVSKLDHTIGVDKEISTFDIPDEHYMDKNKKEGNQYAY